MDARRLRRRSCSHDHKGQKCEQQSSRHALSILAAANDAYRVEARTVTATLEKAAALEHIDVVINGHMTTTTHTG
jgi:hypothetical protein